VNATVYALLMGLMVAATQGWAYVAAYALLVGPTMGWKHATKIPSKQTDAESHPTDGWCDHVPE
jgi:hypothetical protein